MKITVLSLFLFVCASGIFARGQNIEVTASVGGQINGGLDLDTTLYKRLEVQNGWTYGLSAGYLFGHNYGVEFAWHYNQAGAVGQPRSGAASTKLFNLDTNQYFGNFLYHFTSDLHPMRPFVLVGLGATNLSPNVQGVDSTTRFVMAFGGGVKYNISRHVGLRFQAKWSPTYITTTANGYWCDPVWGGCWASGNSHYLNELDGTAGITFRF
jgi:outer membrane protein W